MADSKKSGESEDDSGAVRYISEETLRRMVENQVDVAVAEYASAFDAPAVWDAIKKHDKILLGNGRPGLIEEMAVTKPMVAKLEGHLKAFNEFEIQTKVDRQTFFNRFDQIEKKVDDGIKSLRTAIEPMTGLYDKLTKGAVAIGFFAFLAGGLLMFLLGNGGKIVEFMKWMTTK